MFFFLHYYFIVSYYLPLLQLYDRQLIFRIWGDGCHPRVVPPGQLLRRPSTPRQTYFMDLLTFASMYL